MCDDGSSGGYFIGVLDTLRLTLYVHLSLLCSVLFQLTHS